MDFLRNVTNGNVVAVEENSKQRSDYLTQRTSDGRFPLYEQISQIQIGQPYPVAPADYGLPSGINCQIFEVTDHVVPAGTDSTEIYPFGTTDPISPSALVLALYYIEIAEAVPDNAVGVQGWDAISEDDFGSSASVDTATRVQNSSYEINTLLLGLSLNVPTLVADGPRTLEAQITAYRVTDPLGGPTTEDIHIVLARAVFVVV